MEFAFDAERERLAGAVTAAVGVPPTMAAGDATHQPFDRGRWDAFCRGPGAATLTAVSREAMASAASIAATLEALGHAAGLDTACLAFGCQLAGVLHPLVRAGSLGQRAAWLDELLAGEAFGAPVVPARPSEGVTATPSVSGVVVTGTAAVASFGLRPDYLVVPVSTGADDPPSSALLCLPVDIDPGLEWQPAEAGSPGPDRVTFRGLAVGEDRIVLGGKAANDRAAHAQAVFCLGVHALRIGLLRRLGDVALAAARTATRRMKLTGRPPARFQALTHPIADFMVRCDAARLLVHEGARRLDASERVPMEALLAAFNIDTALFSYASAVVGLQRHWGLAEGDDWGHLVATAAALGRYAWSPVALSERVCTSLRERPRTW